MLSSMRAVNGLERHACGSMVKSPLIVTTCRPPSRHQGRSSHVMRAAAAETPASKTARRENSGTQRPPGKPAPGPRTQSFAERAANGQAAEQQLRRRRCDSRIYSTSGVGGPARALFDKMQEREGAFVVDCVGEEALPNTIMALAKLSERTQTELGKHITVQPFGTRSPLGFSIAYSALEVPPPLPEPVIRVSARTDMKKLCRYFMESVVMSRSAVVMEVTGTAAMTTAVMAIGMLRSRINWDDLVDDLYIAVLPTRSAQPYYGEETGPTRTPKVQYRFALYPCGREKDNNPRYTSNEYSTRPPSSRQ